MIRLASTRALYVQPEARPVISQATASPDNTMQATDKPTGEMPETSVPAEADLTGVPHSNSHAGSPAPICSRDWDDLFMAVEDRLRRSVAARTAASQQAERPDDTAFHEVVLDCLGALDMLHKSLMRERSQRHQLELDILNAQSKTAQAMALLVSRDVGYSAEAAMVLRGGQGHRGGDAAIQGSLRGNLFQSAQAL